MTSTAILVHGAFFLRRHHSCYGADRSPDQTAEDLFKMCMAHLDEDKDLHRILFYDCPPLDKKVHNPITKRAIDFKRSSTYEFRTRFHSELVGKRKLALRLGRLADKTGGWILRPAVTKELLAGKLAVTELTEQDVVYDVKQKGVDMKVGLDIAVLAHKRLVQQVILVAADADFVPAAKFARREGLDIVLDPMWSSVSKDLLEHVDGITSVCPRPPKAKRSPEPIRY